MDSNNLSLTTNEITNEYDDGVVCFGPVTEDQINRYKRLPRRTVLPSDFELSQSVFESDEDKKDDKSIVLDVSNENTTMCYENSVNITQSTNNFDEAKEEIGTFELKQSISEDSNLRFSSPCSSKCLPTTKLIDTEVINRYIRMGSISSNESSLSENQNKSTFEDETISFTDPRESELIQNNYDYNETNSCEHLSVSSIIEQSPSINQQDDSNNVCALIHCSQEDDTDLSICSDVELGDVSEDSLCADEYSITPGKQRLFDLRATKQSLRAKTLKASAPFMDRIEETTTPVLPKVVDSPFILNDISNKHTEIKNGLNGSSITEISHETSTEHLNQTSNENVFEITKLIEETTEELLISNNLKNTNFLNECADTKFDEVTNNQSMNSNQSLNETVHIQSILNDTEPKIDEEKSMNTMSNMANPTCNVNDYNDEEYSVPMEVDIKSSNTSVVDTIIDETMCTNDQNTSLNKFLNDTKQKFDDEKSMKTSFNMANPTCDVNEYNDEEYSVPMEVDIKSSNTSIVDTLVDEPSKLPTNSQSMNLNKTLNDIEQKFNDEKSICIMSNVTIPQGISTPDVNDHCDEGNSINMNIADKVFDETMYSSRLSANNQSTDLNNTNHIESTVNDPEHKYNDKKSMNTTSNMANSTPDVNDYNDEEYSVPIEVDIKSSNTSVVDTIVDETMYTSKLPTNDQTMSLNKSLNDTKQQFDDENSVCIVSNVTVSQDISTSCVNDHYVEGNTINMSREDKVFDETVYTNRHSAINQSTDLNNTNHIESTVNDPEHKYNDKKSMNTTSNMANSTPDVNDYNDEEYSVPIEVDIKSSNTSVVDTIVDETMYTSKLPTNDQTMSLNKSLNDTKQKFDDEKSMNIMSNIANPTYDVDDYNDEEDSVPIKVNINSSNTSVVDKKIDETMYTNRFSANNQSMVLNKSLNRTNCIESIFNDTEHKFDNEEKYSVPMEVDIKSSNTSIVDTLVDEPSKLPTNDQSTNLNKSLNDTKQQQFNDEKSICIMSNVTISQAMLTSDVYDHYDEGNSINMNIADKVFDETIYTNKLSANNKSMDLNKSLNKTNHIESILNDTGHKFDNEKSMDFMSNMDNPTPDVNDFKDVGYSVPVVVDIKSSNTSVLDTKIDETICTSKFPINNSGVDFKESLNDTEHLLMNNIQNTTVPAIHLEEKLHSSKLNKSMLKNSTISDSSFVESNEVNITCNTTLEDPSCMMRQYLDFEQAVNEICEDITSASCPSRKLNVPKASYDDETLERLIEQTLSSDTFDSTKMNENVSNYDGSNLSVIIENTSLETSSNNLEQNEEILNPNTDVPIISESESIVNEIENNELLNTSAVLNTVESTVAPKSEMDLLNEKDTQIEIKANESTSMNCTITDSGLVENINETKNNESSVNSDKLSEMDTINKMDEQFDSITTKQLLVPENINEKMHPYQINATDIPNFAAFKLIPETEKTDKNLFDQDDILNNDNPPDSLAITKSNNNSLEEFTNLEQMFNFGDNQKEKQVESKTPKTQKLLDFSIIQQTPTFDNQTKKQKLLNFSIVDQTPLKSAQQTNPNENIINSDSLINFSSIDQMWNSEIAPKDEINFRDFQNSSSNNLSTISSPDVELLADESIKINTSQFSNSSFNQTITDSNLNLSTYSCTSNKTQNNIIELNNVEPLVLINKQSLVDSLSNSLNETIKQDESEEKKILNKHCILDESTKEVKLLSNITLNKTIDSAEVTGDCNHKLCTNSNKDTIVDFSIIDQGLLENVDLKNNTDVMSVDSDRNLSNLIEMSVSIPVNKSDEKPVISSENPIEVKTSDNRSKTSIDSSSNEINSTTLQFEESTFLHNNTELLTDIQMNDESLLTETPEKSSIIDSFHSIELDHVQEDNKRKIDTIQEYDNSEKKMKVETETLKTPMSMLYKIKNMFRSSEKQLSCVNNTKENNLKSGKCYQKLNFGKFEENNDNFTKPTSLKKSEIPTKSKIPCKVTDRLSKNDEFNNSSLSSLNDSIKPKKTIPKFSGVPVLSDVSNSSNRKCTESRIPSKFQK
ncbi:hypothetical protein AGLY_008427 [Aphis glycines]|uniref:Uncharacterized protein n=1 Tax=Aphis glycines TaxID=307491 RepID=A0A6G0TKV3_APHGL|nr:hypothetical protein AGLY_008427 [Aphis glycines]